MALPKGFDIGLKELRRKAKNERKKDDGSFV
jgi:hypothetical protein